MRAFAILNPEKRFNVPFFLKNMNWQNWSFAGRRILKEYADNSL